MQSLRVFLLLLFSAADGRYRGRRRRLRSFGASRPNVVLILTDDQDVELGSMDFMPKTLGIFRAKGVHFQQGLVTTPICCPSRSSLLSGKFMHNHQVFTNNDNCTGDRWIREEEPRAFHTHLRDAGYATGYFGKYLNEYNGSYIPAGWDEWMGLIKNSKFYNYSLNHNGRRIYHGADYRRDYLTDLVGNDSIRWIRGQAYASSGPFLAVLSFPAPHGPEDPAPQHADLFPGIKSHRSRSWNYAPNPDKEWLLRHTGKMEPVHVAFTDHLHRRRLQTLQSVDTAVQRLVSELRQLRLLSSTYIIYTSDHGYHLGQYGLIKGKNLPYDFDIKVPYFVRGPGLPRGLRVRQPVTNLDIAPTVLDMAGLEPPEHFDGRSFLPLLRSLGRGEEPGDWRDTVLIERGKTAQLGKIRERFLAQRDRFSRELRLEMECGRRGDLAAPCGPDQRWVCRRSPKGRLRIAKCRAAVQMDLGCVCPREMLPSGRRRRHLHRLDQVSRNPKVLDFALETLPSSVENEWEDEFLSEEVAASYERTGEWYQGRFKRSAAPACHNASLCPHPRLPSLQQRQEKVDERIRRLQLRLEELERRERKGQGARPTHCQCFHSNSIAPKGRGASPSRRHPLREPFQGFVADGELLSYSETRRHNRLGRRRKPGRTKGWRRREKKLYCSVKSMNCFVHGPSHWKTEPLWPPSLGSFCFCQNSNNNSYACLRVANSSQDFLYCEYITGFVSFYDVGRDPGQLANVVFAQPLGVLEQLSAQLKRLKACRGWRECEAAAKYRAPDTRNGLEDDLDLDTGIEYGSGDTAND